MRFLRETVLVLAVSFNALAAAYYAWAAVSGGLTSHAFSSEAMPFTLLYIGRALTPTLAVLALVWVGLQRRSERSA